MTPLHQPKSSERGDFKEDDREKEPIVPQKKLNKRGQIGKTSSRPATRPGEQLRQNNKGKHVCNADVIE